MISCSWRLSTDVVLAFLQSLRLRRTVLPALHKLCIQELELHCVHLREAVSSVMESRWPSGCVIMNGYESIN